MDMEKNALVVRAILDSFRGLMEMQTGNEPFDFDNIDREGN